MKYLIISDIHGSSERLKLVMEKYHSLNCDKIILLGDILYHGPRNPLPIGYNPKEVFDILNTYKDKIIAVRGNCDAEVDQWVLEFPMMCDYTMIYEKERQMFLTHGHIFNPERLPVLLEKNAIFLYGHTHIYELYKKDDLTICNPGSISLPKNGNPPSFAVMDDNLDIKLYELGNTDNIIKEL